MTDFRVKIRNDVDDIDIYTAVSKISIDDETVVIGYEGGVAEHRLDQTEEIIITKNH